MLEIRECFYHNQFNHFVIAVSKKDNYILLISITSNNFDNSCRIEPEEIIDNNHNEILDHTSYIAYKFAYEFEYFKTFEDFRKIYNYKCNISEELLIRIIEGAKQSPFLIEKYKKYFI